MLSSRFRHARCFVNEIRTIVYDGPVPHKVLHNLAYFLRPHEHRQLLLYSGERNSERAKAHGAYRGTQPRPLDAETFSVRSSSTSIYVFCHAEARFYYLNFLPARHIRHTAAGFWTQNCTSSSHNLYIRTQHSSGTGDSFYIRYLSQPSIEAGLLSPVLSPVKTNPEDRQLQHLRQPRSSACHKAYNTLLVTLTKRVRLGTYVGNIILLTSC